MNVKKVKWFTEELVKSNPDCVFIFGDTLLKVGKGGQAIIRDHFNAYGIPTKKHPSMSQNSFFYDSEYDDNCQIILSAIDNIPKNFSQIVFPIDGLGTGLAKLNVTAPKTYKFLIDTINNRFGDIYEY